MPQSSFTRFTLLTPASISLLCSCLSFLSLRNGERVESYVNRFFDLAKLIADRLPILNNLIVELAVIGLLLYAVKKLFEKHS